MKVIIKIDDMKNIVKNIKKNDKKIGFVPTMGFLHEGHISLIKAAKRVSDIVIISIFVNPLQFGPNEDYENYPRDIEKDKKIAKEFGVDYIFYPEDNEMYKNNKTLVNVIELKDELCGAKRPGHFQGVTTVVLKLFNIMNPDFAVFGLKDAQQVRIIEKMVEDLNLDITIIRSEIIRELSGLAKSSRNIYLKGKEKEECLSLVKSLDLAKNLINSGERNTEIIKDKMKNFINKYETTKIDYISIVDFESLKEVKLIKKEVLIAEAIFVGKTRLIDNALIKI